MKNDQNKDSQNENKKDINSKTEVPVPENKKEALELKENELDSINGGISGTIGKPKDNLGGGSGIGAGGG